MSVSDPVPGNVQKRQPRVSVAGARLRDVHTGNYAEGHVCVVQFLLPPNTNLGHLGTRWTLVPEVNRV